MWQNPTEIHNALSEVCGKQPKIRKTGKRKKIYMNEVLWRTVSKKIIEWLAIKYPKLLWFQNQFFLFWTDEMNNFCWLGPSLLDCWKEAEIFDHCNIAETFDIMHCYSYREMTRIVKTRVLILFNVFLNVQAYIKCLSQV